MANYTDNYQLTKPLYSEIADVAVINHNMDTIDDIMHNSQISLADAYDLNETYNTGDIVMYEMLMYACLEDNVTGAWDGTKWERTTASACGGGETASEITYDNTTSGMTATNVQDAIDELQGEIEDIPIVEANPQGEATEELSKVGINNTIYEIVGGEIVYGSSSGAIATFADGGDNKPLNSLKVAINPVQASGTPTPESPIPISGWTGASIKRMGKNLVNWDVICNRANNPTSARGIDISYNNGVLHREGTATNNGATKLVGSTTVTNFYTGLSLTDDIPMPKGTYICKDVAVIYGTNVGGGYSAEGNGRASANEPFTMTEDGYITPYVTWTNGVVINDDISLMIYVQSDDGTYEPYNGTTYPITWSDAGTVYGGELDVTDGVIHPCKYYASYNGETLVGEWQSSMDEYAEGTSPTIGAQVVDFGAYDTDITIQVPTIRTRLGNNNIWSDTGDIEECVYQRDLNLCINDIINRLEALEA